MAKVAYQNSSPYAQTSTFGNFLDVMVYRPITKKEDDVLSSIVLFIEQFVISILINY